MSEKDKTNVKKLSRRLLSGFRKGKKLNSIKEQAIGNESLLEKTLNCSEQELNETAEADICLTEKQQGGAVGSSTLSPRRKFFHRKKSSVTSLNLSTNDHSDPAKNLASPRRLRFPQAGQISKSSSTDSGIDCSLLLSSEIGSPEQLAAFSRREAERLRIERKQAQNESVLEPLAEVDRSSGEEGDSFVSREDGATRLNEPDAGSVGKQIEQAEEQVNILSELKTVLTEKLEECEKTKTTIDGAFLKESTLIKCEDRCTGRQNRSSVAKIDSKDQLNEDICFVDTDPNDKRKTMNRLKKSEEKLNNPDERTLCNVTLSGSQSSDLDAKSKHSDTSAFFRSKSIKRSVSDVGKGILGHFRHKRKGNDSMFKDESFANNHSRVAVETKNFLSSKFKRLSVRRKKKSKDNVHIVDLPALPIDPKHSTGASSLDGLIPNSEDSVPQSKYHVKKPAKRKHLSKSNNGTCDPNKDGDELRRASPVFHQSLHDLTNSICEMTNALSVGTSSAESLPCICDCEKKKPNCCEKRRTPPDGAFSSDLDVAPENHSRVMEVCSVPDDLDTDQAVYIYPETSSKHGSGDKPRSKTLSANLKMEDFDLLGEITDDTDDSEWEGDCSCEEDCQCYAEECSDPDCLECCRAGADSLSEDSDCDNTNVEETLNNPPLICNKLMNVKVDELDTAKESSSSSSTVPSSEKQSSPEEDLSFNLDSSFSVSFKEIDFENGDVMYVEDCDNLFPFNTADDCNKETAPRFTAMNETPGSSPQMSGSTSVDTTPTPLNLSDHSSFTNISFEETKKKDGDNPPPENPPHVETNLARTTFSKSNVKRTSLNESTLNGSYTHLINNANKTVINQVTSGFNKSDSSKSSQNCSGIMKGDSVLTRPYPGLNYTLPSNLGSDDGKSCIQKSVSGPQERLNKSLNAFDQMDHRKHTHSYADTDCIDKPYSFNERRGQQTLLNRSMPEMDNYERYFDRSFTAGNSCLENNGMRQVPGFVSNPLLNESQQLDQSLNASCSMETSIKSSLNRSQCEGFDPVKAAGHSSRLNHSLMIFDFKHRSSSSVKTEPNLNNTLPNMRHPMEPPHYGDPNLSLNCSQLNSTVSGTPPLDLSMSRHQVEERKSRIANRSRKWLTRHIGQVYSPAKRVLHKNRGLSETDLCRQILDLYVSDAGESGYEPGTGTDTSFDTSAHIVDRHMNVEDSILQYGTYVAPRNVSRETNVDDFTTTTVQTCYSGEAKTRKLQNGNGNALSLRGEDRRRAAEEEMKRLERSFGRPLDSDKPARRKSLNSSMQDMDKSARRKSLNSSMQDMNKSARRKSLNSSMQDMDKSARRKSLSTSLPHSDKTARRKSLNSSLHEDSFVIEAEDDLEVVAGHARFSALKKQKSGRSALKDRTNMSSSPLAPSVSVGKSEKSFDQLTMLHTVRNGQRKVRCLTLDESMSVIKHYPPPKEASRISWGQTLDEMDLYRHTPRKTPVKTRPILMQKDKDFPYDDDTPSPIVLTKMRKPKSFAKKYKNWPWS